MGPRGHGPIKQKCSLCQPSMFPNGVLGFSTFKNIFASPVGFQTTFWDSGHLKIYFGNTTPFCQPSGVPSGGFFSGKKASPKKGNAYLLTKLRVFAILANIDLTLRLNMYKICLHYSKYLCSFNYHSYYLNYLCCFVMYIISSI